MNKGKDDWVKLIRQMNYLNGSKKERLTLSAGNLCCMHQVVGGRKLCCPC